MTYFLLPVLGKQVNRSSWNHWTVWLLDTKSCLWQRGLCELMPLLCDGQDLGQRIRVMGWPPGLKTEASCRSCTQWSRSDRLKSCVKKLLLIHWGQFNGIAGVPMQRPREKKHRVNSGKKAEPDSVVLSNFLSFFSFMERGEEIQGQRGDEACSKGPQVGLEPEPQDSALMGDALPGELGAPWLDCFGIWEAFKLMNLLLKLDFPSWIISLQPEVTQPHQCSSLNF